MFIGKNQHALGIELWTAIGEGLQKSCDVEEVEEPVVGEVGDRFVGSEGF